jgi:hypothetical protein
VSVSLDVTGSMAASGCDWWGNNCTEDKIGDLIDATNMLIDLLVSDTQTPTYSKMAIVPWSYAVNVGSTYANSVRGTPTAGVSISAVTWYDGTSKNINTISNASTGLITVSDNTTTLQNGQWVYISGVSGMTQINGTVGQIAGLTTPSSTTKRFRLVVNGNNLCTTNACGYSNYSSSSGDMIRRCLLANCLERVTTSAAHGIASGDSVYIRNTVGTSNINNGVENVGSFNVNYDYSSGEYTDSVWTPTVLTTTTYSLPGTSPSNGIRTSGGTSYCVKYGCSYFSFTDAAGGQKLWQPNTCVTDRTTNTYTDAAPSTTPLGFNYRSGGADCIEQEIVPLTTNKTTLHALADSLVATGSTSGHLGLAWGWYMVAPNFAYLWPTASQPKAYGSSNLLKVVIFMTDGDFNTPYCNGVVASDALSGAGWSSDHINCASPNGSSKSQAEALCTAIKATSGAPLLYTIGFDLAGNTSALTMLQNCATSSDMFYQADDGTDLEAAFQDIADTLSELRISK